MEQAELDLAREAARKLYEKGLFANSIIRSLKKGGHPLEAIAHAVKYFPEVDAMLFGEAWGGDTLEQWKARTTFLSAR